MKVENYGCKSVHENLCFLSCSDKSWFISQALQSQLWALWRTASKYYCLSCTVKEKPVLITTIDLWISSGTKNSSSSILGNKCKQHKSYNSGPAWKIILLYLLWVFMFRCCSEWAATWVISNSRYHGNNTENLALRHLGDGCCKRLSLCCVFANTFWVDECY